MGTVTKRTRGLCSKTHRAAFARIAALAALAGSGLGPGTGRAEAQVSPNGSEFQVNSYTTSNQLTPAIASDPSGNFVVAWNSNGSSGTDTSNYSVQAQRYDATGNPLGSQFQVNTYTTSFQSSPAVAIDTSGNFVVAWQSFGSSGTDTSSYSVQAQRYDGLFRDGFETGDTSRWSAAVP